MCQFLVLMVYVSIPSIDGLLVNSSCCSTGDLSTARLLLNEDNVSDTTDTGLSLLHISCISGGTQSVCQPLCLPVCVCISVCLSLHISCIYLEVHSQSACQPLCLHVSRVCVCITIRHLLSVDSTKTLVSAFVLSRLDYCNSLLSGCPKHLLDKLQKVQNSAARLVLKARNEITSYPSSKLVTGCLSKHESFTKCEHFVTPFSPKLPLFIFLTFFMCTLHQDSSAPLLTQELYEFHA